MQMIALYIILGLALLIGAILLLPYTLVLEYKDELKTQSKILFVKLPSKGNILEKAVPILKDANSFLRMDSARSRQSESKEVPKRKQNMNEILEVLSLTRLLLERFFVHLRVKVARFNITVATGDPATTAIAYGATNQAIASLYSLLEDSKNVKNLKRAQINVGCDFFLDSPTADIKLSLTIRAWQALEIIFSSAIKHARNLVEKDRRKAHKSQKHSQTKNK